ncbi:MAG: Rossmann-fold NAD(P)-binding domain-containing protein [Nitrososphaerales archaeon]
MEQIRVLLYGGCGWIGQQIADLLKNNDINYVLSKYHVENIRAVEEEMDDIKPTHIISSIGRTRGVIDGQPINSIDYLEYPTKLVENVRDNLYSPLILAKLCQKKGIHMTYIGTGCIFNNSYPPSYQFTEEDNPNFFGSSYSIVKGFTDQIMSKLFPDSVLNVRIRMPITEKAHSSDFISKIVNYPNICSIDNSMTVLDDLLPILLKMILQRKTGTINLVNPGYINHNQILTLYKKYINPDHTWSNIDLDQQRSILKSDRSNNVLSSEKLEKFSQVPHIKDSIEKIIKARSVDHVQTLND